MAQAKLDEVLEQASCPDPLPVLFANGHLCAHFENVSGGGDAKAHANKLGRIGEALKKHSFERLYDEDALKSPEWILIDASLSGAHEAGIFHLIRNVTDSLDR